MDDDEELKALESGGMEGRIVVCTVLGAPTCSTEEEEGEEEERGRDEDRDKGWLGRFALAERVHTEREEEEESGTQ